MIILNPKNIHWLDTPTDNRDDKCAHGNIEFSIKNTEIIKASDGDCTVSAAALFLLRTIDSNHTIENPVSESSQLIPCCGFTVWLCGERFPLMIMGCTVGIDVEIIHHNNDMIIFKKDESVTISCSKNEWIDAVLNFSDQVLAFYKSQEERNPVIDDYDKEGWTAFWLEWKSRIEPYGRILELRKNGFP